MQDSASLNPSPAPDDPQGMLHLCGVFLEYLRMRNYSPRTVYNRGRQLAAFRRFANRLGLSQARQVTRAVVLAYQSYLFHYRKSGGTTGQWADVADGGTAGEPLTVAAQKHMLIAVSAWFSYLTREGLIAYNPASDLELPRKDHHLPHSIPGHQEIEAIMNSADTATPLGVRDRAILEVLYSRGFAGWSCATWTWGIWNWRRGVVHVEQGKGKKDRVVPIGSCAGAWLGKYLAEVRAVLCPSINEAAVFLNNSGWRYTDGRMGSHVHKLVARSGVAGRAAAVAVTCSATPLPRNCCATAATCGTFRSCSATPAWRARNCTPTWRSTSFRRRIGAAIRPSSRTLQMRRRRHRRTLPQPRKPTTKRRRWEPTGSTHLHNFPLCRELSASLSAAQGVNTLPPAVTGCARSWRDRELENAPWFLLPCPPFLLPSFLF